MNSRKNSNVCVGQFIGCALVLGFLAASLNAQQSELKAVVVEVGGIVKSAPAGVDTTKKDGWKQVRLRDELAPGTQIKTIFKSHVALQFGDDTIVQVKPMSLTSIDQSYADATGKTVKMGLGYGALRGGSIESELRSDVVIDSTVATLAKRGTEGFQLEVEPSSYYFEGSLSKSGLVNLLSKLTGDSQTITGGESTDNRSIGSALIKRKLKRLAFSMFPDESQSETENDFSDSNQGGNSVASPGSSDGNTLAQKDDPEFVNEQTETPTDTGPVIPVRLNRPEGDFGVPDTFGAISNDILNDFLPFKRIGEGQLAQQRAARSSFRQSFNRDVGKARAVRRR